jgi:DNA-binding transcriptional LysR family regulator
MPTVTELETFVAVFETGSFQGAARRLNASPPAISKRISELESDLGVRLFERSTRHCHITARGRALVAYAHRVLGDIAEIQRTVGKRSSLVGHIRLGIVETIAFTKLPELLAKFSIELTKLTVDVEVGVTTELVRKVLTHQLDLACVVAPVWQPELVSEPFWEVGMSWIAPGPRWSGRSLTIDALAQHPIMVQTGSRHIPVIEGWFKSRNVRVSRMITCNSLSAAVKMTAAGLGLSLVPIECARQELDAGIVCSVPVQVQLPVNSIVTIYPTGQVEPALGAVIGVIRGLAGTLAAGGKHRARSKTGVGKKNGRLR